MVSYLSENKLDQAPSFRSKWRKIINPGIAGQRNVSLTLHMNIEHEVLKNVCHSKCEAQHQIVVSVSSSSTQEPLPSGYSYSRLWTWIRFPQFYTSMGSLRSLKQASRCLLVRQHPLAPAVFLRHAYPPGWEREIKLGMLPMKACWSLLSFMVAVNQAWVVGELRDKYKVTCASFKQCTSQYLGGVRVWRQGRLKKGTWVWLEFKKASEEFWIQPALCHTVSPSLCSHHDMFLLATKRNILPLSSLCTYSRQRFF